MCTCPLFVFLQMLEMDPATMMVTMAQKGGESHTREVSLTVHGDSFQSYSHRTAGPVEDATGLEVCDFLYQFTSDSFPCVCHQFYDIRG